ncbi:arylalkylamine N-acetyltransferase-like 2 [Prorops nasuta]|uniref:arylalkylamine N-acetyltransferase-like 2 n=1 Tax=Prorops nasuta TaxID=863751 RepID=UPI0034CE8138
MFQCFHTDAKGTFEFRLLTEERIEDALAVQAKSMHQECIANGVGMYEVPGAPEEMLLVFREVIKDGCTIVAIDTETKAVVAVAFNKLHTPLKDGETDELEVFVRNNIKHQPCLNLIKLLTDMESKVDLFEKYNAEALMEIFYVGTDPTYQGRQIGQKIIEKTIEFCRQFGSTVENLPMLEESRRGKLVTPTGIFGVFTSNYSQKIAANFQFECLYELCYDDYYCNGRKLSDRIDVIHKTAKFAALRL